MIFIQFSLRTVTPCDTGSFCPPGSYSAGIVEPLDHESEEFKMNLSISLILVTCEPILSQIEISADFINKRVEDLSLCGNRTIKESLPNGDISERYSNSSRGQKV